MRWRSPLLGLAAIPLYWLLLKCSTQAQIGPDGTLPTPTKVNQTSQQDFKITGGSRSNRGGNLFHSFREFSVPNGGSATFENALDVKNIISRVTGSAISNIQGSITTQGSANLFLLNPNGIIFGPQASLNIGGSFIGTTASSILFQDGTVFSAKADSNIPVLTVSTPIGLQFGKTAEAIRVSGSQLQLKSDRTLALVGGDVTIQGNPELRGKAGAGDGLDLPSNLGNSERRVRVEIGSVASQSQVRLAFSNRGIDLQYLDQEVQGFKDITLFQGAVIEVGSGEAQVQGRNIKLVQGSIISSQTASQQPSGDITVRASESLELAGVLDVDGLSSALESLTVTDAAAGDITIITKHLILRNGAAVSSSSFFDEDPSGNIILARGQGGSIRINASEMLEISGSRASLGPTSIDVISGSNGDAGNITINTAKLIIRGGARISAATLEMGQGGGGDVAIRARESVAVIGTGIDFDGSIVPSTIGATSSGPGNAGNIVIKTDRFIVRNGAEVTVSSQEGTGAAGRLDVDARSTLLERGQLTAATASGNGGNIFLNHEDLLQLSNRSQVSATAVGTGAGGNVDINTRVLALSEDSKIMASASEGAGGNIQIETQGLFTFSDNQLDASSDLGVDGEVEINRPEVDPARSLVDLPVEVVNVETLVARGCEADNEERESSRFVVTGRGGLPPSPEETNIDNTVLVDFGTLDGSVSANDSETATPQDDAPISYPRSGSPAILEAQGWVVAPSGKVMLIAQSSSTPPGLKTACHVP